MTKIDIISGFLGAGKTTFIKKMIDEAFKGEQIVLIENEFGEVGIDGGFLKDAGIQITEMNSGCICCSLVGDFGKNLNEVITKYHPDRILIEPSGVGKLSDVMKSVIDIEKEQPVNVGVRIENKSRIPVSRLEAKIKIQNRFYQPEKEVTFQGMADGRGTTRLTTAITSSQCGLVALWVEQVKIWDLFHLFGKRIETDGKEELSVLPEYYEALLEITPQIREQLIESEEYDEKRPGDDPSQIFQIREYREGDRIQRIHWKASARTSQLMVKDYSMPIGLGALLLFDLQVPEESGAVFLDQAIEYGLAILQGFLNQEYPPRAAWYNCRTQNMEQIEIRETEDLYLLTSRLFQAGSYREEILWQPGFSLFSTAIVQKNSFHICV